MATTENEIRMLTVLEYGTSMDIFEDIGDGMFKISPTFREHVSRRLETIDDDIIHVYGVRECDEKLSLEMSAIDVLYTITGLNDGVFFEYLKYAVFELMFSSEKIS